MNQNRSIIISLGITIFVYLYFFGLVYSITFGIALLLLLSVILIPSKEQINNIAKEISQSGAHILRGGAFKPRTSPYEKPPGTTKPEQSSKFFTLVPNSLI